MRVALIVDDNRDIRMLLKQALEMENYQIFQAENGVAAQQQIAEKKPCVILLDLMMPVMDGRQFLQWKNTQPELSEIPVVVISAVDNGNDLTGAIKFLRKPIDLKDMIAAVDEVCCC